MSLSPIDIMNVFDDWTFKKENPIVHLDTATFAFFMAYIKSIVDPKHRLFLFAVYVRLHGSNKIINTKTHCVKIINDTIADDFRKYLEIFRASIEERTLKIFVSFYYILMAIETKNGMWILSMVSASKKSIDADIMRVHINKDTGEITYTKPDCLKE